MHICAKKTFLSILQLECTALDCHVTFKGQSVKRGLCRDNVIPDAWVAIFLLYLAELVSKDRLL